MGQNTTGNISETLLGCNAQQSLVVFGFVRTTLTNLAMLRPIRRISELPEKNRNSLLRNMKNYLRNCELEDKRLRSLKERVNRP